MATANLRLREGMPPGPKLPTLVQTVLFLTARHRIAPIWQRRYGDVFTMSFATGRTSVVLTRPEHIREVFAGSPSVFHAGEGNEILGPIMGEHSVLMQDDEAHLQTRKRLMPAFNGAALRGYSDMMAEVAEQFVRELPVGRSFAVHQRMNALTLEIILRVVFGIAEGPRLTKLRSLLRKLVSIGPVAVLGWAYQPLQRYWPWRTNVVNRDAVDQLIYAEIAERRTASDLARRTDVLSRLLSADGGADATDAELRDHMITLLLAGHETTATALAWSFYELSRRPDLLRKAQAAADEGDTEYLTAVTKEAMRLRPVIYAVARKLTEPTEVAGYTLPAGVIVAPSIGLVQADAAHFPEPDDFRPERFVGAQPDSGTWIPFGGGVRRCIGAEFSLREAAAVLGAALTRYDLAPGGRPEHQKSRNITLVPSRGARIVVTPRQ